MFELSLQIKYTHLFVLNQSHGISGINAAFIKFSLSNFGSDTEVGQVCLIKPTLNFA